MARRIAPQQKADSEVEDTEDAVEQAGAEDNRDVFDKALDYAPVGGAVLGLVLGSRVGAKQGAKLYKKHEGLQNKIRRLEAKGRNPHQGLTAKDRTDLDKARTDAEHVLGEWGGNLAGRSLKAGGGAIIGNLAGSAARDAGQKRRK